MYRFGWSGWGFLSDDFFKIKTIETPDGACYLRSTWLKHLAEKFSIYWLQKNREKNLVNKYAVKYDDKGFPDIDILFIEWRWKTWKNDRNHFNFSIDKYESDFDRQTELFEYYKNKIPIVIWDSDLKLIDNREIRKFAYVIDSSIKCYEKQGEAFLFFDDENHLNKLNIKIRPKFLYIGANYERNYLFDKYIYQPAKHLFPDITTHVYGNWLNYSPERESPEKVLKKWGDAINFHKRCDKKEQKQLYQESLATVNIMKDEYASIGLLTSRFIETLHFGLIPFVPTEFYKGEMVYGKRFVVDNGEQVAEELKWLLKLSKKNINLNEILNSATFELRKNFSNCIYSKQITDFFLKKL